MSGISLDTGGRFSDVNILDLLAMDRTPGEHGLTDFVARMSERLGLLNIVYHCQTFPGRTMHDPFLLLTYDADWVSHYRRSNYVTIDPVFNGAAHSLLPIDWGAVPRVDRRVIKLFNESQDAGVGRQGLTVPVRGPENGLWAVFSVTADDNAREWDLRKRELTSQVVLLAHFIHQRAYELHRNGEHIDLNALTRRECEALSWTAEGKTVADIAVLMKISSETVKAHLDSARYKLGALNRVHAVAKAIRHGLIR